MDKVEQIFKRYERRAKANNLSWLIDYDFFVKLISGPCFYCGQYGDGEHDGYIGVDRLDNRIGYVQTANVQNCVGSCSDCNMAKGPRMTPESFIRMCLRVAEHQKKIAEQKKAKQVEPVAA